MICPICQNTNFSLYRRKQAFRTTQFGHCDLYQCTYCEAVVPERSEPMSQIDEKCCVFNIQKPTGRFDFMRGFLKYCRNKYVLKTALDIGTNSGRFCVLLQDAGIEAYGIDIQNKAVEFAQKQGLKVYQANFPHETPQEINGKTFDLIACNECIYYFEKLEESLAWIKTKLSNSGVLFLKVHLVTSQYYKRHPVSLFSRYGDYVKFLPTQKTIKVMLEKAGYQFKEAVPFPDNYFIYIFGFKLKILGRIFNEIYYRFFLNKEKSLNYNDSVIFIATK